MSADAIHCPRCANQVLGPFDLDINGVEPALSCAACGGLWFRAGQLDDADESIWVNAENLLSPASAPPGLACPICPVSAGPGTQPYREPALPPKLVRVTHPSVPALDASKCSVCGGFWLGRDGLTHVRSLASLVVREITRGATITLNDASAEGGQTTITL